MLIGGFVGVVIMVYGFDVIQFNIILKIVVFIFLVLFIGMVVVFGFMLFVFYICCCVYLNMVEMWFKKLQFVFLVLFSIGYGLNDFQKVMGIIVVVLIVVYLEGLRMGINSINDLLDWVVFFCFIVIFLGMMLGGWKIVKIMGIKIIKVIFLEGVVVEIVGVFILYLIEYLKIFVSIIYIIIGVIIGVGVIKCFLVV